MKKFFIFALILSLLIPSCAAAEQEKTVELGPFSFDATGTKSTSSGYHNILNVFFDPIDDGVIPNAVIWYTTFEENEVTLDDYISYYGTDDLYSIALYELEYMYGPNSDSTYTLGYTMEDIWPYLNPRGVLFNSVYTVYSDDPLAGALLICEDGILGIECTIPGYDLAAIQEFRLDVLNRLSWNGEPIVQSEPDPNAPVYIDPADLGKLSTFSIDDYTFETQDYFSVDDSTEGELYFTYQDETLFMGYINLDDFGISRSEYAAVMGIEDDDYSIAKSAYDMVYIEDASYNSLFSELTIETDSLPFLFSGRLTDEYGGGWMIGAVLTDDNGMLVIELCSYDPAATYEDVNALRTDILSSMKYNGQSLAGSVIPAEESAFAADPSHQFSASTIPQKLRMGETFSYSLEGSRRDEDVLDESHRERFPTAVSRNITYDHGMLTIGFTPYELFGNSREWLLKTMSPTDPEKALANYYFNIVKNDLGRFGSNYVTDGPYMYGEHAYLRFTGEYSNYGSTVYISGFVMTEDDGVLVLIYYPEDEYNTADISAETFENLLNNLRYQGAPLDLE